MRKRDGGRSRRAVSCLDIPKKMPLSAFPPPPPSSLFVLLCSGEAEDAELPVEMR